MLFARSHALLLVAISVLSVIGIFWQAELLGTMIPNSGSTSSESVGNSLASDHNDRVMCHLNRIQAKQEIIQHLIQDCISLHQAAEQFLELLKGDELALAPMRQLYPASNDLQSCAKSIVEYVRSEITLQESTKAQEIQARIQQQYQEQFACLNEDSPLARE